MALQLTCKGSQVQVLLRPPKKLGDSSLLLNVTPVGVGGFDFAADRVQIFPGAQRIAHFLNRVVVQFDKDGLVPYNLLSNIYRRPGLHELPEFSHVTNEGNRRGEKHDRNHGEAVAGIS